MKNKQLEVLESILSHMERQEDRLGSMESTVHKVMGEYADIREAGSTEGILAGIKKLYDQEAGRRIAEALETLNKVNLDMTKLQKKSESALEKLKEKAEEGDKLCGLVYDRVRDMQAKFGEYEEIAKRECEAVTVEAKEEVAKAKKEFQEGILSSSKNFRAELAEAKGAMESHTGSVKDTLAELAKIKARTGNEVKVNRRGSFSKGVN